MSKCEAKCHHGVQCQGEHEEPGEHYEWAACPCCGSGKSIMHLWRTADRCDALESWE